jgi:hypothetical protein
MGHESRIQGFRLAEIRTAGLASRTEWHQTFGEGELDQVEGRLCWFHSSRASLVSAWENTPFLLGRRMICCTRHNPVHELESRIYKKGSRSRITRIRTIVPYVIRPTRAYGGRRLKLTTIASRSALRSSSSKQVSTTKRKIGGTCAGRLSVYSIVVYFGNSSAGRLVFEMSL